MVVARHFVNGLPTDLADHTVADRKRLFVAAVLPLILQENERLQTLRVRFDALQAHRATGGRLSARDRRWLESLAKEYRVPVHAFGQLSRRIGIIPPSLAIAQAAEETGWGTSRFARLGNALFGQWTFQQGRGIVPLGREQGERHEIKAYTALAGSIRDYMHNLNTHPAYKYFRHMRAEMRDKGTLPAGYELSTALQHYSARGEDYVRSLRAIIRVNRFADFDGARLDPAHSGPLNPS